MEDVWAKMTHHLHQPPEKTDEIPAVALAGTNSRNRCYSEFGRKLAGIKLNPINIKPAVGGQCLRQGDQLTLSPAVTQVMDSLFTHQGNPG
jgi:hypothetical protein